MTTSSLGFDAISSSSRGDLIAFIGEVDAGSAVKIVADARMHLVHLRKNTLTDFFRHCC